MTADGGAARGGSAKPTSGRPRDGRIDAAIIAATRELIVETGYTGLTLSAIAARAGTTTAALYRRWSGKAQLVHEAVLEAASIPPIASDGDPESDIRALVETVRVLFDRPEVRVALPGLIADTVADPDLHARMITRLAGNMPDFESRFGQARGADHLPVLAEVVAGAAIFRLLVSPGAALDETWVAELTSLITGRWLDRG